MVLESGDNVTTIDAGIYKPASLGDKVWEDENGDGVQDSNEAGLENVIVKLVNEAGNEMATTSTNGDGYCSFNELLPGTYKVKFIKPEGYKFTLKDSILNDALDSDASILTGETSFVELKSGDNNLTLDAGLYKPTGLGNYVWLDNNANGIQDSNETGVAGVRVHLLNSLGVVIKTTLTDENGKYLFDNLLGGKYTITIDKTTLPEKTEETYELDGTLDNTVEVELQHGELKDDVDFGYAQKSSIGDYVWLDSNGDGLQDEDESGIANVIVTLIDVDGNMMLTETDEEGKYIFEDLAAGKYTIEVNENTLPADLNQTYELDGSLNDTVEVDLAQGEIKDDVDFGYSELIDIPEEDIPFGSGEFLPKTGSPIDLVTMMIIGLLMLLVGAVVIIFENKKTSKKIEERHKTENP